MGCCLGKSNNAAANASKSKDTANDKVKLTAKCEDCSDNVTCKGGKAGKNVQISKCENGNFRVEGNGTAIGSCSLECDTAYFEVKLLDKNPANVLVGIKKFTAKQNINFDNHLDSDMEGNNLAWYLKGPQFKENDVIGVHWDQTDFPMLSFTLNGQPLTSYDINRVKPAHDMYAAVSVKDSNCEFIFDDKNFLFQPKARKFRMIVCATSII